MKHQLKGSREAVVLQIGNRYYARRTKHRIVTAWSLAGSQFFVGTNEPKIKDAEDMLIKKGYKPVRRMVRLLDTKDDELHPGEHQ